MIEILGYADRFAVRPGETIAFKVSCEAGAPRYRADIVRLRCGDDRPDGPGFRETEIEAACAGDYPGRQQPIECGSYVRVAPRPALDRITSLTMTALIWPTLPGTGEQTIMGRWRGSTGDGHGYALGIDADGRLCLRIGGWRLASRTPLQARRWYRVLAGLDAAKGYAKLLAEPLDRRWGDWDGWLATGQAPAPIVPLEAPFLIAAHLGPDGRSAGHFNGKIEAPRLLDSAAGLAFSNRLEVSPLTLPWLVAAWDFSLDIPTSTVRDLGPNRLDGVCVNLPARAMTGHNWSGETLSWRERPAEYAAIHFHEDDLQDCGWDTDFAWTVPAGLRSGVYAARLRCSESGEDHVPFVVLPPRGRATAPVALLASTATYLAYANSHDHYEDPVAERCHGLPALSDADLFLMQRRDLGLSTYDHHRDGSGVCHSSRLRPILNTRPKRALWNFNADLHIVDWLEAIGQPYDVIDDETLDREGAELLSPYRCLVTGTHPEYCSAPMMRALLAWRDRGGRLMYLGGNGFYWRIAFHPTLPGVIEMRRGEAGSRIWAGAPGESLLAFTGEPSGLWRISGIAPQRLVGVGFISEGFDVGSHYRRLPAASDPRAAFVLAGVAGETFGDYGAFGGAAALELDIADVRLGTPPHALRLAASEHHSNLFVVAAGETNANFPGMDGIESPLIRADLLFFEVPGGGAVFSTGSIGWAASLAHAGYDNDVARITGNVLRRFLDPAPFAPGRLG
jgi:N,N-dimethylformamidase